MLTTCGWRGKEFTCEFKVIKGEVMAVSYDGKTKVILRLKDISNVLIEGDTLILTDFDGESLTVRIKTGMSEAVNYILQYLEMRDKGDEILDGLVTVAGVVSGVLTTSFDIIKSLRRGAFPDWGNVESLSLHVKEIVERSLRPHLSSMKSVDDLISNVKKRHVTGVRINIKTLLRESVLAGKKFLNNLTELINLEEFIDVILLLHAYFLTEDLGLIMEKDRAAVMLERTLSSLHSRIFALDEMYGRSLTNWVLNLIRTSGNAEDAFRSYVGKFNEYIIDYYQVKIPKVN